MVMEKQTFECAFKAMRIGRHVRRPHWPEGMELYLDRKEQTFKYITLDNPVPGLMSSFEPMTLLAEDWQVLLV